MHRIDQYARQYIGLSPFCCLATSDGRGHADVTPRGDRPGFVRILDEKTLLVPERPGNNRMDSLRNIIENPSLGMLFFIPGFEDTLRRVPSIEWARRILGFRPRVGLREGLRRTAAWCRKHYAR